MTLAAMTRLGSFEILAKLGAGGMGEVYRARDTRLDREVAIKVLPEAMAQDPTALSRFQREARAVAALSHPNIRAIYDIGIDEGKTFAIMELLEGDTLASHLAQAALHWREAAPRGGASHQMTGTLPLRVRLNVAPWLKRTGRIYLVLPAQQPGGMTATWTTHGLLLPGQLTAGSRSLVYSGLITTPFI